MRIAIVGAGFAGLSTAKVLTQVGHEVQVFDKTPDVGGVWSASRRYPGVQTQSPRDMYALSDFPMPKSYPEWPSGAQVQEYLASYATAFGLDDRIRLNTEVTSARAAEGDSGWRLQLRSTLDDSVSVETCERLIIANGVFCEPLAPSYAGVDEFEAAGGHLCVATEFLDAEQARGKQVVVVGYGKSACDVAVAISDTAAGTSVVARQLLWKVPKKVGGFLNFKYLLLTRLGEALFRYRTTRGVEKFLHGPGNGIRRRMLNSVGSMSVNQYKLTKLNLLPTGTMEGIVHGAIGLVTDGFFERVEQGTIVVHRDQSISRLLAVDGHPFAELDDGSLIPADLVVCATGFTQGVPFLDADVYRRLLDERGNFMLYRQILPLDVANLYFAGYNSSFFSPLNAEMAAAWIAADLAGGLALPDTETMRRAVVDQLAFMDGATSGHHCRGTKIIPFSMHNVDEVLDDLQLNIPAATRAAHWLGPIKPHAYRNVTPKLVKRLAAHQPAPPASGATAEHPSPKGQVTSLR
jgi:hypothetical protein